MWFGILVFLFVGLVGKMTLWRVHTQLCEQHLTVLPSPEDPEVMEAPFGHASVLFNANAGIWSLLAFWKRGAKRQPAVDGKSNVGSKRPVPVPRPRALDTLKRWSETIASTFRVQLFGRRCIVTSAPAFARRVLHTHFKLYEKNAKSEPNTQMPPSLPWFIGYDGLLTRPDTKDRQAHGQTRVAFAQALLHTLEAPNAVRLAVARCVETFTPIAGPVVSSEANLTSIRRFATVVVLDTLLGGAARFFSVESMRDLVDAVAEVQEHLDAEVEAPWKRHWLRISPSGRALRQRVSRLTRRCVEQCLADATAAVKMGDCASNAIEQYMRGERQLIPADAPAKVRRVVDDALVRTSQCELLTAVLMGHGAVANSVAWVVHYCALPQNHGLVSAIRAESATSAPQAADLPGAVEALREVLRLHPPVPIITRTVLNDDMVAVPDLHIPADKLRHKAAAMYDTITHTSFAQRSGCVVVPSSCVIIINMDLLLKRTDVFGPDAAEFRPSRFVGVAEGVAATPSTVGLAAGGARNADAKTWYFAGGFGIGARGCPAAHWSLSVAAEIVRHLVSTSDFTVGTASEAWSVVVRPPKKTH